MAAGEPGSDAVALIVGYARIDAALLDRLPALRILATMSAGYDMVDMAEARRRGLWVANLPDAATEDVAVHALAATLSLVRRLPQADAVVRSGGWNAEFTGQPRLPRRERELTLGLVGLGRIARSFATLAAPVFGHVAAHDPHADPAHWPAGVARHDDLGELAAATDRTRGADPDRRGAPVAPRTRRRLPAPGPLPDDRT